MFARTFAVQLEKRIRPCDCVFVSFAPSSSSSSCLESFVSVRMCVLLLIAMTNNGNLTWASALREKSLQYKGSAKKRGLKAFSRAYTCRHTVLFNCALRKILTFCSHAGAQVIVSFPQLKAKRAVVRERKRFISTTQCVFTNWYYVFCWSCFEDTYLTPSHNSTPLSLSLSLLLHSYSSTVSYFDTMNKNFPGEMGLYSFYVLSILDRDIQT